MSSQRGNEEDIGTAMSEVFSDWLVNRPDVWVTGKHWPESEECPTPSQIKDQLKQTLQALKMEYLDLYLLPASKNEKIFKVRHLAGLDNDVLVYTTPLRHHLMPESMIDNLIVAVAEVRLDS